MISGNVLFYQMGVLHHLVAFLVSKADEVELFTGHPTRSMHLLLGTLLLILLVLTITLHDN